MEILFNFSFADGAAAAARRVSEFCVQSIEMQMVSGENLSLAVYRLRNDAKEQNSKMLLIKNSYN